MPTWVQRMLISIVGAWGLGELDEHAVLVFDADLREGPEGAIGVGGGVGPVGIASLHFGSEGDSPCGGVAGSGVGDGGHSELVMVRVVVRRDQCLAAQYCRLLPQTAQP